MKFMWNPAHHPMLGLILCALITYCVVAFFKTVAWNWCRKIGRDKTYVAITIVVCMIAATFSFLYNLAWDLWHFYHP